MVFLAPPQKKKKKKETKTNIKHDLLAVFKHVPDHLLILQKAILASLYISPTNNGDQMDLLHTSLLRQVAWVASGLLFDETQAILPGKCDFTFIKTSCFSRQLL